MKKLSYSLFAAIMLFAACKKEVMKEPTSTPVISSSPCGTPQVQTILAGQTIPAGTITVSNDATNLYVTYTTTGGWVMKKTHLYVGACSGIPTTHSGNPQIGLFPYQTTYSPSVTSFTYTIPLAGLDPCYCIAAHAELDLIDGSGNVIQTETGWGQGDPMGGSSWAMVFNYCTQTCTSSCTINPGDFRTQTQGGWGAVPNGGNPGSYMQSNFAVAFPAGLMVGCTSGYSITLTTSTAVTDFLPQGGTAAVLTQSYIDPLTVNNVLAGQVVSLTLSVGFDNTLTSFGASAGSLSSLVITTGVFSGWNVGQLLTEANNKLGGCSSIYSAAQLNAAVTSINENFDNGTIVGSFLTCP